MKRIRFGFCLAVVSALAFSATASAQLDRFQGVWENTNLKTPGILRIRIETAKIQVYGACNPNPCDWGEAEARAYGPTVSSDLQSEATAVLAHYETSFCEIILIIKPLGTDELEVESYTHFTDGSGRTAYTTRENLRRGVTTSQERNQPRDLQSAASCAPTYPATHPLREGTRVLYFAPSDSTMAGAEVYLNGKCQGRLESRRDRPAKPYLMLANIPPGSYQVMVRQSSLIKLETTVNVPPSPLPPEETAKVVVRF